jgi:hypothetical protein
MRPRKPIRTRLYQFRLNVEIADSIDLLLVDPLTGKVPYSARGELIESLFRQWLREQQRPSTSASASADSEPKTVDNCV